MVLFQPINPLLLLLKIVSFAILFLLPFVHILNDLFLDDLLLGLISQLTDHLWTDEDLVLCLLLAVDELHINQLLDDVVEAGIYLSREILVEDAANDVF